MEGIHMSSGKEMNRSLAEKTTLRQFSVVWEALQ